MYTTLKIISRKFLGVSLIWTFFSHVGAIFFKQPISFQGYTIHTLALAGKETFFTHQQKNVTCQINKDINSYYTTPICIYSWIIINALNETEDACMFQDFYLIKLFLCGN
jgi:hypothetical protein